MKQIERKKIKRGWGESRKCRTYQKRKKKVLIGEKWKRKKNAEIENREPKGK